MPPRLWDPLNGAGRPGDRSIDTAGVYERAKVILVAPKLLLAIAAEEVLPDLCARLKFHAVVNDYRVWVGGGRFPKEPIGPCREDAASRKRLRPSTQATLFRWALNDWILFP